MAEVITSALSAQFTWALSPKKPLAAEATRGTLSILAGSEPLWGDEEFEWTWIETLEWLSSNWLALIAEDGLPFGINAVDAGDLTADRMLPGSTPTAVPLEDAEMALWLFRETHDLARSLPGTLPEPFVLWKEGYSGHFLTGDRHLLVESWDEVEQFLDSLGQQIADRIEGLEDARATIAAAKWRERNVFKPREVVSIATGIAENMLPAPLLQWRPPRDHQHLSHALARDELLAAARMTAGLATDVVTEILSVIQAHSSRSSAALDAVAADVVPDLQLLEPLPPHEQGQWVARMTRDALGLQSNERFDIDRWLTHFNVAYEEITLDTESIDAVAAWGSQHGPVIIINKEGRHANSPSGRNASVGHELAHLLMDRHAALPAAEVLGGRSNPRIEQRARAFAADLLLPRSVAFQAFEGVEQTKTAIIARARQLADTFGVSLEITAWQARNFGSPLTPQVRGQLARLVTTPWLY